MYCSKCGKPVPKGAVFCPSCGARQRPQLEPTPPRVETFRATEVVISEMLATVMVVPANRSNVQVTIGGDEEMKRKARVDVAGSALKISCELPFVDGSSRKSSRRGGGAFVGGSVVIGGMSSSVCFSGTSIINGVVYINGREVDMDRELKVTVEVPKGTTIKVGKLLGKAVIGDTEGNLVVKIKGVTVISAGKVRDVAIRISGSGSARIREATGAVQARISGSGSVVVDGGTCESLNASISGSGSIHHGGAAKTAQLDVSGSGNIHLRKCLSAPTKSRSGSGRIIVSQAPRGAANAFSDW